ncbi:MAG: DUF4040 domain-containing protein [Chromatiaceae bacterium]|nr:MAG: DUF4040 domain-containing protein [Chromatiaceae bacterium]
METMLLLFDALLLLTTIPLALVTVTSPEPRRAVMLFIAFTLTLALIWARLAAPDVALAEAAVGAGLGGALMLAAARRAARVSAADTALYGGTPPTADRGTDDRQA